MDVVYRADSLYLWVRVFLHVFRPDGGGGSDPDHRAQALQPRLRLRDGHDGNRLDTGRSCCGYEDVNVVTNYWSFFANKHMWQVWHMWP